MHFAGRVARAAKVDGKANVEPIDLEVDVIARRTGRARHPEIERIGGREGPNAKRARAGNPPAIRRPGEGRPAGDLMKRAGRDCADLAFRSPERRRKKADCRDEP
jgi:hypothetical protein